MKSIFFLACSVALGGCTTVLYKDGATQADYQRDFGQCDYEVSLHANSVDNSYGTMLGQEFDLALRKKELIIKCMKNKGWSTKVPWGTPQKNWTSLMRIAKPQQHW